MRRRSRPALLPALGLTVLSLTAGTLAVAGPTAVAAPAAAPLAAPASTAAVPGAFVGLTPARVLDTRIGVGAPKSTVAPGRPLHVTVAGRGGVPTDAAAVVLTLTVVTPAAGGYLSAYPTEGAVPLASVMNWSAGETLAGSATVTLGSGGALDLLVSGTRAVHLVADVSGYITAGTPSAAGAYVARTPVRLLDTRTGNGAPQAKLGANATIHVPIAGRAGLPAPGAVSAVVATLTAVGSADAGYLTAWAGGERPLVSSVNFAKGQVRANQVTVPLAADGGLDLYALGGPLDAVLDVTGYVVAGTATAPGTYVPVTPSRIYDTRRGPSDDNVLVAGRGGVPRTGAGAVVTNLTVTTTTSAGYLTAWPAGETQPTASNLNWAPKQTVANQASLALGREGLVARAVVGPTRADVIVDVSGYYLAVPPATATGLTAAVTDPGTPRQAVRLTWDAPADPPAGWTVRRAEGTVAPGTPDAGTAGPTPVGTEHTAVDGDVQPDTTYSYALFARDVVPNYSAAATVTVTVPAIDPTALQLSPPAALPLPSGSAPGAKAFVTDLECPAAGSCVGVGQLTGYDPASPGATRAYLLTQRNGTWTAPTVPLLPAQSANSGARLESVDCTGAGACVAVGWYASTAGATRPLVTRVDGGVVASDTVALPDSARSGAAVAVRDVACAAEGTCLAVGTYRTEAGIVPLSLRIDADAVRLVPTTVASGVSTPQPASVACTGPDSCVAVGRWGSTTTTGATHGLTGRWDGSAWTYSDAPRPATVRDGTMLLLVVACPDATHCTATGTGSTRSNGAVALLATGDGTDWAVTVLPQLVPSTTYGGYLDCPDAASCVAVYRNGSADSVATSGADGVVARPVPSPDRNPAASVSSFDIACDAEARCAIPGLWETGSVTSRERAMITTVVDGVPTSVEVGPVAPSGAGNYVVASRVACVAGGGCVLTGSVAGPGVPTTGFLQTFRLPS